MNDSTFCFALRLIAHRIHQTTCQCTMYTSIRNHLRQTDIISLQYQLQFLQDD